LLFVIVLIGAEYELDNSGKRGAAYDPKNLNPMQETINPVLVEKEAIANFSFRNTTKFKQVPDIIKKLEQATRMGNTAKVKFNIDFYTDSGLKTVQTTIWATGTKFICLKGGLWIPIANIVDVRSI